MHARTHARTRARKHACTHARTHARLPPCSYAQGLILHYTQACTAHVGAGPVWGLSAAHACLFACLRKPHPLPTAKRPSNTYTRNIRKFASAKVHRCACARAQVVESEYSTRYLEQLGVSPSRQTLDLVHRNVPLSKKYVKTTMRAQGHVRDEVQVHVPPVLHQPKVCSEGCDARRTTCRTRGMGPALGMCP